MGSEFSIIGGIQAYLNKMYGSKGHSSLRILLLYYGFRVYKITLDINKRQNNIEETICI